MKRAPSRWVCVGHSCHTSPSSCAGPGGAMSEESPLLTEKRTCIQSTYLRASGCFPPYPQEVLWPRDELAVLAGKH